MYSNHIGIYTPLHTHITRPHSTHTHTPVHPTPLPPLHTSHTHITHTLHPPPHTQSLVTEGHYASSEIQSRLRTLSEEHSKLQGTWTKRQDVFVQCHALQLFLRDAEQRDTWLGTQEGFLANEDLGVSTCCITACV